MAGKNIQNPKIMSNDDPLDINELASLNDDISPEFIEQLQSQLTQSANAFSGNEDTNTGNDDTELFEEVQETVNANVIVENSQETNEHKEQPNDTINDNIDDNFVKKYKAKLNKQEHDLSVTNIEEETSEMSVSDEADTLQSQKNETAIIHSKPDKEIETITNGNIVEKPIQQEQISYNDSLDYVDENIKYSKYVIYIAPENKDFIESLTVKERKNLINRLLREQDDIAVTKKRLSLLQTIIKHSIIAIITLAVSVPIIYWTINASLEASINNYRKSQTLFQTLYKEKGKIKNTSQY